MKKLLIVGIVVLVLVSLIITNRDNLDDGVRDLEISMVCYDEVCFQVEIVDTNEERARGLMFRESLCDDCGMLFVYPDEGVRKFWMKNTLIPLDIVWLDSEYKIVHIANAVPCVTDECQLYGPEEDSLYVLEIGGSRSGEVGLAVGSELELVYG